MLIVLAVTVLIWELATRALDIPVYLLPAPELLLADALEKPGLVFDAFVATTVAAALGFIVAAILGIGLGIVIARWFLMEELLYPYLNIIRVTPIIAIAPLLTIGSATVGRRSSSSRSSSPSFRSWSARFWASSPSTRTSSTSCAR